MKITFEIDSEFAEDFKIEFDKFVKKSQFDLGFDFEDTIVVTQ